MIQLDIEKQIIYIEQGTTAGKLIRLLDIYPDFLVQVIEEEAKEEQVGGCPLCFCQREPQPDFTVHYYREHCNGKATTDINTNDQ